MDPLEPYLRQIRVLALEERLFRRLSKLLVGVSGGPDSLAALVLLTRLGQEYGFAVVACHFDHKLRPDSEADRRWVRQQCEALGMQCVTGEGDVAAMAADMGLGIEEAARKMRYQFLAFAAGKENADAIATGHTRDDQVETVLQHIIRGAGVRGLRGMLPRSPVPGAEAQTLVRPLLTLGREDTEEVCRLAGVEPLRDPSNTDLRHSRNRIRHEVLPAIAAVNPGISRALLGIAGSAREAFSLLERASMEAQPLERTSTGAIFKAETLRRLTGEARGLVIEREAGFFKLAFEVNRTRLENLDTVLRSGTGMVHFGDVVVEVSMGKARIGPGRADTREIEARPLHVPGVTRAGAWRIEVGTSGGDGWQPLPAHEGPLIARSPRPGDRLQLPHRAVRLSRLFEQQRIPTWERDVVAVVAAGSRVLAVLGVEITTGVPGDASLFIRTTPAHDVR